MLSFRPTIVLVLRYGRDFQFRDVELIVRHIHGQWQGLVRPRIVVLTDKIQQSVDLGNMELIPLTNSLPGTWSRMMLYSPEMDKYRPFLYLDLDTAVVQSVERLINLVKDSGKYITLEDFYQKGKLATGVVWLPDCEKVRRIWEASKKGFSMGKRMDKFLSAVIGKPDAYFQELTNEIVDFKPRRNIFIQQIPSTASLVCFHGKPRIFQANVPWVKDYISQEFKPRKRKVTVIIPYNKDRGWLKDAVRSVPDGVQLLLSKGDGNWPENFNKALKDAEGEFIRYLHEDDMLTPNCIEDSVRTFDEQGVDFIHGNVIEFKQDTGEQKHWRPRLTNPELADMLRRNYLHSASLMYRREVFERLGGFDETLNTAEEFEFSLRCMKAGMQLGYCNSSLAYYRRHDQQKVRVVPKSSKAKEREMVRSIYG